MFREFLVYHSSSLEFRAELILLMIMTDGEIEPCEEELIQKISEEIYGEDRGRARLLSETIHELHDKIINNNGLEYVDLVVKISNDIKKTPRFVSKINIAHLRQFRECLKDEEDLIFHDRVIDFLLDLKEEHGEL